LPPPAVFMLGNRQRNHGSKRSTRPITVHERTAIDHFHKWQLIINSFESIKISLNNLILKLVIQKNFHSETKLVRLI